MQPAAASSTGQQCLARHTTPAAPDSNQPATAASDEKQQQPAPNKSGQTPTASPVSNQAAPPSPSPSFSGENEEATKNACRCQCPDPKIYFINF
ncbi:hypothetical protein KY285_036300 [Solanum tuberosum]|nr:hypothetical protein KY285_036300 [Solanum tuberosum]